MNPERYNKLVSGGYTNAIKSAKDVFSIFSDRFANEKREHFMALYLDNKSKILKEEIISVGILDSSLVHPREVFKNAIKESAHSIILVHNHPSGDVSPSVEDEEVFNVLVEVDGEKVHKQQGDMEIKVRAYLSKDYKGTFKNSVFKKFLMHLYERFIARRELRRLRKKLRREQYFCFNIMYYFMVRQ